MGRQRTAGDSAIRLPPHFSQNPLGQIYWTKGPFLIRTNRDILITAEFVKHKAKLRFAPLLEGIADVSETASFVRLVRGLARRKMRVFRFSG
jgi:hypothetical protein